MGEALFLPEEDLNNFGDISFGLDSIPEDQGKGDGSPAAELAAEMDPATTLIQVTVPVSESVLLSLLEPGTVTAQHSIVCIDSPCSDTTTSIEGPSMTSILREEVNTEYMDVDVVMINDNNMRIDDVVISSNVSEVAVGPTTPMSTSTEVLVYPVKLVLPSVAVPVSAKATATAMASTIAIDDT